MELDTEIIKWGGYVLSSVLGWFIRVLWTAQDQMRKDFSKLEAGLPLAYVRRDEFKEVIQEVKDTFKETSHAILNKLDRMEEKHEQVRIEIDNKYQRRDSTGQ